jgi:hypothetical protein
MNTGYFIFSVTYPRWDFWLVPDLKSLDGQLSYRFDSGQRHHKQQKPAIVPVFSYLSEEYRIDLLTEVEKKIALNGAKYPVEKAKGSAKKYSKLD